jgi:hypothetical protein
MNRAPKGGSTRGHPVAWGVVDRRALPPWRSGLGTDQVVGRDTEEMGRGRGYAAVAASAKWMSTSFWGKDSTATANAPVQKAESGADIEGASIAAAVAAAVKPPMLPAASLFLKSMNAASLVGAVLAADQLAATLVGLTSTRPKPFAVIGDGATPDGNDLKAGIGADGFLFGTAVLLSPAALSMSSGTTFLRSGFLFNGPTATPAITPAKPKVTHETLSKSAVSLEGFGMLKNEDERINHATINRNINIDLMPGGPNHCGGDLVFTHL